MKVLVSAPASTPGTDRLRSAALGLALRGHEVDWYEPAVPAGAPGALRHVRRARHLWSLRADVVLGGSTAPWHTTVSGWLARAHCMVLGLEHASVHRWRQADRWAWHTLYSCGLIESAEAGAFQGDPAWFEPGRIALWSDGPPAPTPDATHPDTEILERACERAIARHLGRAERAAVFVDRDGTLVREKGYLSDPDELELLPGVPQALKNLSAAGYPIVLISNQSGVERGLFPLSRVYEAMARLRSMLRAHGVELDAIYFCPHRPEAACPCRKPRPGLLQRAAEDLQLSLRHSVMIGDKLLDAATGRNAGGKGVLVRTGYGRDEERLLADGRPAGVPALPQPDVVCEGLAEAAAWFQAREHALVEEPSVRG